MRKQDQENLEAYRDQELSKLKEQLIFIKDEYKKNKIKREELEQEINELNENIYVHSQIKDNLLQKRKDYELFEIKNPEKKLKIEEKEMDPIEDLKLLTKIILKSEMHEIANSAIKDFKILTENNIQKIPIKENKIENSGIVETILVKFDPIEVSDSKPITIRVISEYYTMQDLLDEACFLKGLNPKTYYFLDEKDRKILNFKTVKNYIKIISEDLVNRFVFLKKDLRNQQQSEKGDEENKDINQIDGLDIDEENYILNEDLKEAEDNIINRLGSIIGFLIFLSCVFVISLSNFEIHQNFFIDDSIKSQVFKKTFFKHNIFGLENNFENISNNKDIYDWLTDVFLKLFVYRSEYGDSDFSRIGSNIKYNQTLFLDNYLLLGKIRFMEFYRIKGELPPFHEKISSDIIGIKKFNRELDFEKMKICRFNNETNYYFSGQLQKVFNNKYTHNNIDCSGFYWFDLDPEKDLSKIFISHLKNILWIDYNTEFFVIQFNGYNINRNIIVTIKLIFEQAPNGLVKTNYKVCILNSLNDIEIFLNFQLRVDTIVKILVYLMILIYSLVSSYDILKYSIADFKKYFTNFWNIFHTAKVIMFLASFSIRFYLFSTFFKYITIEKIYDFIDTDNLCNLENYLMMLEALNSCTTLMYFLKFLDKDIIGPISNTLSRSLKNIFVFLVCFLCSLSGYAFFSYFIYGTRSLKYKNLSISYIQVVYMIFGDLSNYNELLSLFPIATQLYSMLIGMTFLILFNNWLIAVIMYSFSQIGLEKKKNNLANGIVHINFLQEITLIKNKLMRNVRLIIDNIFIYYESHSKQPKSRKD